MKLWLFLSSALLLTAPLRAEALPSFLEVRSAFRGSDGKLLDREGRLLQEQRLFWNSRVLDWVSLNDVSPSMRQAVTAIEDRRFFSHHGVDIYSVAGALWQNMFHGGKRGASTISMQTVGLIEGETRRGRRSAWQKVRQARLAWELERGWSKDQILEAYLNLVSFRGEQRGISAAARALFGKDPHGLDLRESYLLATLLRSPGMSAEAASRRLCQEAVKKPELGECSGLSAFTAVTLAKPRSPIVRLSKAPHLARRLLSPEHPEIRSTIDLRIQQAALDAVQDQLQNLKAQNARDAAVIVVENKTGEVLAYVGGSGSLSSSPEVDMAESRRQAGSTLKPFLYGLAFHKGILRPDSWLLDEPYEVGLERGSYEPDNYDHLFHGPVSAKVALASSLNIPAVRVLGLVGVDSFRNLLERLGFRSLEQGEHYGPSLALGTADVTLTDLTRAYLSLANKGELRPLVFEVGKRVSGERILGRKAADEVAAVLADRGFRSLTFGWDSMLATAYSAAVKTGTSKDMRDNWCVGFSRNYTVGVWVGNASGDPMWQVSGVSGAAPIWRSLMDQLHKGKSVSSFPVLRADAREFDRGNFGKILYPLSGSVIAVDPDIPSSHQRLEFEAEGKGLLQLDGQLLTDTLWKPVKGKHQLRLSDSSGKILDELYFEVR